MVPVLAQMTDRGDMHDGGWGWWWLLGLRVMLLLIALVVVLVVRITSPSQLRTPSVGRPPRTSAEEVLADRMARGEIDTDEYRQRLSALRGE
jgi:putative membrane protein